MPVKSGAFEGAPPVPLKSPAISPLADDGTFLVPLSLDKALVTLEVRSMLVSAFVYEGTALSSFASIVLS